MGVEATAHPARTFATVPFTTSGALLTRAFSLAGGDVRA